MRFAVSIITPEVQGEAPLALLTGDFDQRLAKAASYGYQGVELVTCDPSRLDGAEAARQLACHGLAPAAVATGFIAASRGLTLSSPDSDIRRQAAALLEDLVRFSAAVGSKVVTIGSFRGRNHPAAAENLQASLAGIDDLASGLGVTIALEPIHAGESDFLTSAAQVCQFIDRGNFRSVGLLLDTYHVFLSEPEPLEAFRLYRRQLAHVHLADSERKAAGRGAIDFAGVERVLEEIGYEGWQSAELARADDPDGNARYTMESLRS